MGDFEESESLIDLAEGEMRYRGEPEGPTVDAQLTALAEAQPDYVGTTSSCDRGCLWFTFIMFCLIMVIMKLVRIWERHEKKSILHERSHFMR